MTVKSTLSTVLDPDFTTELVGMSATYHDRQAILDESKWVIAASVNDWWGEHKSQFSSRDEYFAECSRVMNIGRKRKLFSDSGETLKVFCNVRSTYDRFTEQVEEADKFLDLLSFDHLRKARSLYMKELVRAPFDALVWALENRASADEMQYHFDPPLTEHPADATNGKLEAMLTKDYWQWLKSPTTVKRIIELVREIQKMIAEDK